MLVPGSVKGISVERRTRYVVLLERSYEIADETKLTRVVIK